METVAWSDEVPSRVRQAGSTVRLAAAVVTGIGGALSTQNAVSMVTYEQPMAAI